MTHPHREFNNDHTPLAFLISFRCYGTWLHGDARGSVDRFHNRYSSPRIAPNRCWFEHNQRALKRPPVNLSQTRRAAVKEAIEETCRIRRWKYWICNIRTNHVHTVVSANCDPEIVLNAFKANATRKMREAGCWQSAETPWVRKGSKRRLWTEQDVISAIVYVEYEQGEPLP
jgi:REP element-mobilizing transposase RayT